MLTRATSIGRWPGDDALGGHGRQPGAHKLNRFEAVKQCAIVSATNVWLSHTGSLGLLPLLARRWRFRCRRVGRIPAPRGGPVGRPGEWIRVAKSPKAAHRGH